MTIEEAIEHCKKEAENQRRKVPMYEHVGLDLTASMCNECAAEHEQLAEWLTELKQRREAEITAPPKSNGDRIRQMTDDELAAWITDGEQICDMCAFDACLLESKCEKGVLKWLKQEVSEDAR